MTTTLPVSMMVTDGDVNSVTPSVTRRRSMNHDTGTSRSSVTHPSNSTTEEEEDHSTTESTSASDSILIKVTTIVPTNQDQGLNKSESQTSKPSITSPNQQATESSTTPTTNDSTTDSSIPTRPGRKKKNTSLVFGMDSDWPRLKVCPKCQSPSHIQRSVCHECGFIFKPKKTNEGDTDGQKEESKAQSNANGTNINIVKPASSTSSSDELPASSSRKSLVKSTSVALTPAEIERASRFASSLSTSEMELEHGSSEQKSFRRPSKSPPIESSDLDESPPPLVDILANTTSSSRPSSSTASSSSSHRDNQSSTDKSRQRRNNDSAPAQQPSYKGKVGRPVGWRKPTSTAQNVPKPSHTQPQSTTKSPSTKHEPSSSSTTTTKPAGDGPKRKTTKKKDETSTADDGTSMTAAEKSAAIAAATAAEVAALETQVKSAWAQLEFKMMKQPLDDVKTTSADDITIGAGETAETARLEPDTNGTYNLSIVKPNIYMDADERKELLEHIELLKQRRESTDGNKGSKCSRVGPRYQCKVPLTLPPPITPEIQAQIRDEPYDYARFARDEHPVPMGDFDLQLQLVKSSTGFPSYPLDERYRKRIGHFITKRRERKRREEERRAQQSISQQVQEARAGFSFHAVDITARKGATTKEKDGTTAPRRSKSPPFNPLDSYGSITMKDIPDSEGADGLESKRRSSRITPSLVVKQRRGPATASTDSGNGLPTSLDQYAQLAADKRNAREQAEADRKLAEKLQAFYEREPNKKIARKKEKKESASPSPPAKERTKSRPHPGPSSSSTVQQAQQQQPHAVMMNAAANVYPSVSNLFHPSPYPISSLTQLSYHNNTTTSSAHHHQQPHQHPASAHSESASAGSKRKRSISPDSRPSTPERKQTIKPQLIRAPPPDEAARVLQDPPSARRGRPPKKQQEEAQLLTHYHQQLHHYSNNTPYGSTTYFVPVDSANLSHLPFDPNMFSYAPVMPSTPFELPPLPPLVPILPTTPTTSPNSNSNIPILPPMNMEAALKAQHEAEESSASKKKRKTTTAVSSSSDAHPLSGKGSGRVLSSAKSSSSQPVSDSKKRPSSSLTSSSSTVPTSADPANKRPKRQSSGGTNSSTNTKSASSKSSSSSSASTNSSSGKKMSSANKK